VHSKGEHCYFLADREYINGSYCIRPDIDGTYCTLTKLFHSLEKTKNTKFGGILILVITREN
jgi:hypothetical protein